jgi:uncharacterized protein with gpF-like domain
MRKRNWRAWSSTERQYYFAIADIIRFAKKATKGLDDVQDIINALMGLTELPAFRSWADSVALKMVKTVMVNNAQSWREAARTGQRGAEIHKLLRNEFKDSVRFHQLIVNNSEYIKRIPKDVALHASQLASKEAMAGRRGGAVVEKILEDVPHLAKWKAKLIARTEIAKTQASITQIRAQDIGINCFQWVTAEDGNRVRPSHRLMDRVYCRYDDLPAPEQLAHIKSTLGHYGPGGCPNCRCIGAPYIEEIDEIRYPVKVYSGGQIKRLGKKAFIDWAA